MQSLTTLSDPDAFPQGENGQTWREEKREGQARTGERKADEIKAGHVGGAVLLVMALFLSGLYYGGFADRFLSYVSGQVETSFFSSVLVLQKLRIRGQERLSDEQIIKALGIRSGQSLLGFDAARAQKRLSALGLVKSARVMRLLPSTLLVEVRERHPYVRWRRPDGQVVLVDEQGVVLTKLPVHEKSFLPFVSGGGANIKAAHLIRLLSAHPVLARHTAMAERVGHYRWNLWTQSGALIQLPPEQEPLALARLVALPDWQGKLRRAGLVIDLRQQGAVYLRNSAGRQGEAE